MAREAITPHSIGIKLIKVKSGVVISTLNNKIQLSNVPKVITSIPEESNVVGDEQRFPDKVEVRTLTLYQQIMSVSDNKIHLGNSEEDTTLHQIGEQDI